MNLATVIAHHARSQPDKIAVEGGKELLTYAAFDELVRRLAARLRAAGVGSGDLVGVRMKDSPAHAAAFAAVGRVGGIILPLDWRSALPEIQRIAERFRPKVVLADDAKPLPQPIVTVGTAGLEQTEPDSLPFAKIDDAPFVFGLTSGTTGEPKGIILTHNEMFARIVTFTVEDILRADDRFLSALPLAYAAGREFSTLLLCLGATLVMFPTLFEPKDLVKAVNEKDITALILSPNMSRALITLSKGASERLMPNLRLYVSSTGKLQPEERAALSERVAPNIFDFYGSTGTGPIAVIPPGSDEPAPTAAGRPAIGIEIEVVDEDHKTVADGDTGRVRIRGPGVTHGFAGGQPPGDESMHQGWYYPGDLGSFDERGVLHLRGRAADLIKRGGLMIHAQEVEHVLRLHQAIVDAAVVGIPSPQLGEELVAFIMISEPVEPQAVILHCRQQLAAYKVPQRVEIMDDLPRNAGGKVVKALLRQTKGDA
jgi:acyl-CoA synthetase (AMP-forming)/AMP-acid ligase II